MNAQNESNRHCAYRVQKEVGDGGGGTEIRGKNDEKYMKLSLTETEQTFRRPATLCRGFTIAVISPVAVVLTNTT